MAQYSRPNYGDDSWESSAYEALSQFLVGPDGRYSCGGWKLSHWITRLSVKGDEPSGKLQRMRKSVDALISTSFSSDGVLLGVSSEADGDEVIELWRSIGFFGYEFGVDACYRSGLRADKVLATVHEILVKKQKDYGHGNITKFGRIGLIVRMQDKVARLENLLAKGVSDEEAENESVYDNVIDVMGYSAIGIMWERGEFTRNLSSAKVSHPESVGSHANRVVKMLAKSGLVND